MSISTVRHLLDLVHELDDSDIDSDFGLGVHPHEIHRHRRLLPRLPLMLQPRSRSYPYAIVKKPRNTAVAKGEYPIVGKDGFQMCIDVGQFKPSEISVKTIDHTVIVEGKHEEREDDHGIISRHFIRKYTLPKDYDPNDVVSTLSSDGILSVKAPPPAKPSSNERIVQIQQTGPAHLSIKENAGELAAASDSAAKDGNATNGEKSNEKMED